MSQHPITDPDMKRLDQLAYALDARFRLPGTNFRFGWDTILGLIPGLGDTITLAPSAWIVWRAYQRGLPKRTLAKMCANTGIDYTIGLIPLIGDVFDMGFKANLRNAALFRDHLQKDTHSGSPSSAFQTGVDAGGAGFERP